MTTATATIIASRRTADGVGLAVWSDGGITDPMGRSFAGVYARGKGKPDRIAAAWLLAGEAELFTAAELGALYRAALKVARLGGTPGDVRALASQVISDSRADPAF